MALDFPEIPGEEHRNSALTQIREQYNPVRDANGYATPNISGRRSRAASFNGSVASNINLGEGVFASRVYQADTNAKDAKVLGGSSGLGFVPPVADTSGRRLGVPPSGYLATTAAKSTNGSATRNADYVTVSGSSSSPAVVISLGRTDRELNSARGLRNDP